MLIKGAPVHQQIWDKDCSINSSLSSTVNDFNCMYHPCGEKVYKINIYFHISYNTFSTRVKWSAGILYSDLCWSKSISVNQGAHCPSIESFYWHSWRYEYHSESEWKGMAFFLAILNSCIYSSQLHDVNVSNTSPLAMELLQSCTILDHVIRRPDHTHYI